MKVIIEIDEKSNLVGLQFKEGKKVLDWDDFTRIMQIKILNAMAEHHNLFFKFLKEE